MAMELQELIDKIRTLPPGDQERLRLVLDNELAGRLSQTGEEEFQHRLVQKGLLKSIKPHVTDFEPYRNREPFEIEGKPLSETIVEERR